jgi:serine/threonine protein kinase
MAPELLLTGRASPASDVYAYGILLWELSTGQRALAGDKVEPACIIACLFQYSKVKSSNEGFRSEQSGFMAVSN